MWTLLLGENGAGKSTVLRAIALGLAGSDALPELLLAGDDWIKRGQKAGRIALDLVTAEGERRHVELGLVRGEGLSKTFEKNRASLELLDAALGQATRSYFTIGYGVSRRLQTGKGMGMRESMRHPRAQCVATLFQAEASLRGVEAWAMDLDYRKPREARAILKSTFAEMLPGIEFEKIDKEKRKLLFRTPEGTLPLELLSDGYQNIISWCGDLLYRVTETFHNYKKPLEARGVLLIDEVDLHLHPLWQRRLMEFLRKKLPNFQILATTHSPLTAHQAGEGELYLLRREGGNGAPHLEAFGGEPRKMLLHQFLLSPAFGLETADSLHVEEMKERYGQMKEGAAKEQVAAELREMPGWQLNSKQAQKRVALLAEIRKELRKAR